MLTEYHKYHTDRDNTRIGLYTAIDKEFAPKTVLYPGSYTDITPSLVFGNVVYIDSAQKFSQFIKHTITIQDFINTNKKYPQEPKFRFYYDDYTKDVGEEKASFDLMISQYAGLISKACHPYLKPGGVLVCNNSHGDADWARLSGLYDFVGVYNRKNDNRYNLIFDNLDTYFIPKKPQEINLQLVEEKQSGYGYTKTPSGYIFSKKQ